MQDVRDERECCGFLMPSECPMLIFFPVRCHTHWQREINLRIDGGPTQFDMTSRMYSS